MPQVGAADGDISRLPYRTDGRKNNTGNLRDRMMFGEDLSNRGLELLHASYLGLGLSSYSAVLLFPSSRTSYCISGVRSMCLSNRHFDI